LSHRWTTASIPEKPAVAAGKIEDDLQITKKNFLISSHIDHASILDLSLRVN
jgi:hypothetical protein